MSELSAELRWSQGALQEQADAGAEQRPRVSDRALELLSSPSLDPLLAAEVRPSAAEHSFAPPHAPPTLPPVDEGEVLAQLFRLCCMQEGMLAAAGGGEEAQLLPPDELLPLPLVLSPDEVEPEPGWEEELN